MALVPVCVAAQGHASWGVAAENDYFNFWQKPHNRPDDNYTQGFRLWLALPRSGNRWVTLALEQLVFNPEVDSPDLLPGQRPYAGWLAMHVGMVRHEGSAHEEIEVLLGVTGPPSLAEAAQKGVHRFFGFREPLGWKGQLPAEPGFAFAWRRMHEVLATRGRTAGLRLGVFGAAQVGTVLDNASLGLNLGFGLRPPAPGNTVLSEPGKGLSLSATFSAGLLGVGRNEFIQGTLFRSSAGIPIRHLVPAGSLGIQGRIGRIALAWISTRIGKEYPTQKGGHTWSSLRLHVLP